MTCTTCDSCQDLDVTQSLEPQFNNQSAETRRLLNFLRTTCSDPILYKLLYQLSCSDKQLATAILDISKKNIGASQADLDKLKATIQSQLDKLGTASIKDTGLTAGDVVVVGSNGKIDISLLPASIGGGTPADYDAVKSRVADLETKTGSLGTASTRNVGIQSGNVPEVLTNGKISPTILPAVAVNNTYTVASEADMLALGANVGDIAIRTDTKTTYILSQVPATDVNNWQELLSHQVDITPITLGGTGRTDGLADTLVRDLASNVDLDTVTQVGEYQLSGQSTNHATNAPTHPIVVTNGFHLSVYGDDENYVGQDLKFTMSRNAYRWTRQRVSGTWGEWFETTNHTTELKVPWVPLVGSNSGTAGLYKKIGGWTVVRWDIHTPTTPATPTNYTLGQLPTSARPITGFFKTVSAESSDGTANVHLQINNLGVVTLLNCKPNTNFHGQFVFANEDDFNAIVSGTVSNVAIPLTDLPIDTTEFKTETTGAWKAKYCVIGGFLHISGTINVSNHMPAGTRVDIVKAGVLPANARPLYNSGHVVGTDNGKRCEINVYPNGAITFIAAYAGSQTPVTMDVTDNINLTITVPVQY